MSAFRDKVKEKQKLRARQLQLSIDEKLSKSLSAHLKCMGEKVSSTQHDLIRCQHHRKAMHGVIALGKRASILIKQSVPQLENELNETMQTVEQLRAIKTAAIKTISDDAYEKASVISSSRSISDVIPYFTVVNNSLAATEAEDDDTHNIITRQTVEAQSELDQIQLKWDNINVESDGTGDALRSLQNESEALSKELQLSADALKDLQDEFVNAENICEKTDALVNSTKDDIGSIKAIVDVQTASLQVLIEEEQAVDNQFLYESDNRKSLEDTCSKEKSALVADLNEKIVSSKIMSDNLKIQLQDANAELDTLRHKVVCAKNDLEEFADLSIEKAISKLEVLEEELNVKIGLKQSSLEEMQKLLSDAENNLSILSERGITCVDNASKSVIKKKEQLTKAMDRIAQLKKRRDEASIAIAEMEMQIEDIGKQRASEQAILDAFKKQTTPNAKKHVDHSTPEKENNGDSSDDEINTRYVPKIMGIEKMSPMTQKQRDLYRQDLMEDSLMSEISSVQSDILDSAHGLPIDKLGLSQRQMKSYNNVCHSGFNMHSQNAIPQSQERFQPLNDSLLNDSSIMETSWRAF